MQIDLTDKKLVEEMIKNKDPLLLTFTKKCESDRYAYEIV